MAGDDWKALHPPLKELISQAESQCPACVLVNPGWLRTGAIIQATRGPQSSAAMASPAQTPRILRFGVFEVDLQARELRKGGLKLKVHEQPFQVLAALLERPGEVVTREQLRQTLWPAETFVDFEHSINTAVNKLREVLGDSADSPRFVETLARRGYRFLAPVDGPGNEAATTPAQKVPEESSQEVATPVTRRSRQVLPWVLFAVVSIALAVLAAVHFRELPGEARSVVFRVPLPENVSFDPGGCPIVSPNGQKILLSGRTSDGRRHLWLYSLDSLTPRLLPGTEDQDANAPFWSPDSRFVAFFAADKSNHFYLKKIDVLGLQVQTICEVFAHEAGGTWSRDGVILFAQSKSFPFKSLYTVSAEGGEVKPLLPLDKPGQEQTHSQPLFLPDGRHFLYLSLAKFSANRLSEGNDSWETWAVYLRSLDSSETRMLMPVQSYVSYTPPGFLVTAQQETLFAYPFDVKKLRLAGEPFPIAEHVRPGGQPWAFFSVSENGVLLYLSPASSDTQLAWYKRDGARLGSIGEPGRYAAIRMSPDEAQLAIDRWDQPVAIWTVELSTNVFTRLTAGTSHALQPVWSPDGRELVFTSDPNGKVGLYRKAMRSEDGGPLFESNEWTFAQQWLKDGSLLFQSGDKRSFYRLPVPGDRKPALLLKTESEKSLPRVSWDGEWVAYQSDESGRSEVYLAAFPSFKEKRQVSHDGGCQPLWRKDGKELFYLSPDGKLMSVDLKRGARTETGVPRTLFQIPGRVEPNWDQYCVTGDGKKFIFLEPVEKAAKSFTVVLNWPARMKR